MISVAVSHGTVHIYAPTPSSTLTAWSQTATLPMIGNNKGPGAPSPWAFPSGHSIIASAKGRRNQPAFSQRYLRPRFSLISQSTFSPGILAKAPLLQVARQIQSARENTAVAFVCVDTVRKLSVR